MAGNRVMWEVRGMKRRQREETEDIRSRRKWSEQASRKGSGKGD